MKKQNGNRGHIVHLKFPNAYRGYVCCDRYSFAISTNGNHYGYMYEGTVYCNVYPEGRPYEFWINSFEDATGQPPIIEIY